MTSFAGPLIQAGASILGSIVGGGSDSPSLSKQREEQYKLIRDTPKYVRYGAEQAGFNPLTVLGASSGAGSLMPTSSAANPLGDGIARAGMALADGFDAKSQLDMQKAQLELERERLEALRQEVRLNPKVPGIFGPANQAGAGSDPAANAAISRPAPTPSMPADPAGPSPFPAQLDPTELLPDTSAPGGSVTTPRDHNIATDRMTAEDSEKFYGPVGEFMTGARNTVEDTWNTWAPTPWKTGLEDFAKGKPIGDEKLGAKVLSKDEMKKKGKYPNKDNALWWLDHIVPNY